MKLRSKIAMLLVCVPVLASAMPAPKYLSVPSFKQCLITYSDGSATFLCLPAAQLKSCPNASWKQLNALTGKDAIAACPVQKVAPAVTAGS